MAETEFSFDGCKGKLETSVESIKISGKVSVANAKKLYFKGPASPDYITSFTGAGLPYATRAMAYENTNIKGSIELPLSGEFEFNIKYPNAYYTNVGTDYQNPELLLDVEKNDGTKVSYLLKLGPGPPFRTLRHDKNRTSPLYYDGRELLEITTQEQLLRNSGYPETNVMPSNFWGKSVPN